MMNYEQLMRWLNNGLRRDIPDFLPIFESSIKDFTHLQRQLAWEKLWNKINQ